MTHWVASKKAALLKAIEDGSVTRERAKEIHGISEEELVSWEARLAAHGPKGLRVTHIRRYRNTGAEHGTR